MNNALLQRVTQLENTLAELKQLILDTPAPESASLEKPIARIEVVTVYRGETVLRLKTLTPGTINAGDWYYDPQGVKFQLQVLEEWHFDNITRESYTHPSTFLARIGFRTYNLYPENIITPFVTQK